MKSTKRSTVLGHLARKASAATRSVRTTARRASSSRVSSVRGKKGKR